VADSNALAGSTLDTSGAGVVNFASAIGAFNFGGLQGSGNLLLTDVSGVDVALTVGGNNADTSFSGNLSDSNGQGSLTKTGTGVLVLSGDNTYAGGTYVDAGTLVLDSASALANGSSLYVGQGAPPVGPGQTASPVPEPGTLLLLFAGLGAGFGVSRRRKFQARLEFRSSPL
jgi:autotransporter-associated beta strand protein